MRQIIFRGRDKKGQWHYGSLVLATDRWFKHRSGGFHREWIAERIFSNGGFINLCVRHCVTAETVGQFTGVHDKDGKAIYEGDIVRLADVGIYQVCYNEERCSYELRTKKEVGGFIDNLWSCHSYRYEILGNIYDNPELLKGGRQ